MLTIEQTLEGFKVFRNTAWTKRDYEGTNIVAAIAKEAPEKGEWVEAEEDVLERLTKLHVEFDRNGDRVEVYGYM